MKCPFCGDEDLKVVDSRDSETGEAVRRRRECLNCAKRFTTYERIENLPLYVMKKDGRREEFDRQKLYRGLKTACEKREVSTAVLERTVEEIESELRNAGGLEVPTQRVGELVMQKLRQIDPVAYIRFASVYREFMDIDEFERVVKEVRSTGRRPRA